MNNKEIYNSALDDAINTIYNCEEAITSKYSIIKLIKTLYK